jgi:hypothetical protein
MERDVPNGTAGEEIASRLYFSLTCRPGWFTCPIIKLPFAFAAEARALNPSKRVPWSGDDGVMMGSPEAATCVYEIVIFPVTMMPQLFLCSPQL